ncbi:hypothetical protein BOTBODRAFT_179024 [Botryobasidium botryosum FD-172 SS1]|uniref:Uncharacterized protein n=1 Tax=Botryobasidium botryosum (strain FD-172 SS1) TaxID=930990 RepID=A0A067M441_BOTB1|nr:hypothetical protein BOTBODRAFT_179024 [Botryobasidium botryosum FD-172 SS1]
MGADAEERDPLGRTRLHCAIHTKDFKRAKQLVEQGADVYARDKNGWEPLHFFAEIRTEFLDTLSPLPFAEMIQVLLSVGANLNAPDTNDSSLVFRLLVDAGADIRALDEKICLEMRHFIAHVLHHPDSTTDVEYLTVGVNANGADLQSYTYLDRAMWLGSPSLVDEPLRLGADLNAPGFDRRTPLHYAANLMRHPDGADTIKAFVDAEADVNAADCTGHTPLDAAVISHVCPPAFRIMFARRGQASAADLRFSDQFLRGFEGTDAAIDVIEAGESPICDTP